MTICPRDQLLAAHAWTLLRSVVFWRMLMPNASIEQYKQPRQYRTMDECRRALTNLGYTMARTLGERCGIFASTSLLDLSFMIAQHEPAGHRNGGHRK